MHIDYTDAQKQLRRELRAYFSQLMTPELREATRGNEGGDAYKQVIRQLGKDGWLALGTRADSVEVMRYPWPRHTKASSCASCSHLLDLGPSE